MVLLSIGKTATRWVNAVKSAFTMISELVKM